MDSSHYRRTNAPCFPPRQGTTFFSRSAFSSHSDPCHILWAMSKPYCTHFLALLKEAEQSCHLNSELAHVKKCQIAAESAVFQAIQGNFILQATLRAALLGY